MIDTTELMKQVGRIKILTAHLIDDRLAGDYHSVFKGQGVEFDEVRPYIPGDDVRSIDWNVTARTGEPHVKRFSEERELTVIFLVDVSGSQIFGSGTRSKSVALRFLNNVQKRKAVVFLVSDFQDNNYEKELRVTARRHDVIACPISDPCEHELPDVGLVEMQDPESGELLLVDTSSSSVRALFRRRAKK
jgi:uncharacterized protein (DUF58 family)